MNIIFSTVGTSILTNQNQEAGRINKLSNLNENEINNNPDDKKFIDEQVENKEQEIFNKLNNISIGELKDFSAELNGILSYYEIKSISDISSNPNIKQDYHYLIVTDTYVGRKTGKLVEEILKKLGFQQVIILSIKSLNTKNTSNFTEGVKNLRDEIHKIYKEFENNNPKFIFNLTGGFKSVNAFLNILGMFYADEIIYVFETKTDLIKIPKLPININYEVLKEYYEDFLLISNENIKNGVENTKIPEMFIYKLDNYMLNEWGELLWKEIKARLINEKGLPNYDNIEYNLEFKSQFKKLEEKEKERVVYKIALASYLLKKDKNIENLKTPPLNLNSDTQNISEYKFEVESNKRIFCDYDRKNNKLIIKDYRKHISNRYEKI